MLKNICRNILFLFGVVPVPLGALIVNVRQLTNFLYYAGLYGQISAIPGSIVECGVGKGRSFLYFNFLALREGKKRMIWGFDSFEGFPQPAPEDASLRNPKKGDWSDVSIAHIRSVLKTAGIPAEWAVNQTRLVKGFFDTTLASYDGGPIALLHVDADLYESYRDVLTTFFPLVTEGGLVLFDEYNHPKWPGAKRAVDEYFANKPYKIEFDPSSQKHFLFKR